MLTFLIDLTGRFNDITDIFIEEPLKEVWSLGSLELRLNHGHELINLSRVGQP